MSELTNDEGELGRKLDPDTKKATQPLLIESETQFRWSMNQDAMATEKLAEGIRGFAADQARLEQLLVKLASGS